MVWSNEDQRMFSLYYDKARTMNKNDSKIVDLGFKMIELLKKRVAWGI